MSFKITRAAINNPNVYGLHKLVLVILADHEGADKGSWPSVARIAEMCGLSVRHTQRILRDLEEAKEIIVEKQTGIRGTNRYFVVHKVMNRGDTGVRGGDTHVTQGVTPTSPEYIKKPARRGAKPRAAMPELDSDLYGTHPGYAGAAADSETETKYVPPKCLHNPSKSALKCKQCSEQFREGKLR